MSLIAQCNGIEHGILLVCILGFVWLYEIRYEEADCFALKDTVEVIQRHRYVGPFAFGLEKQDFTNKTKDMLSAFFGRNVFFDSIGKEYESDFVAVSQC